MLIFAKLGDITIIRITIATLQGPIQDIIAPQLFQSIGWPHSGLVK